MSDNPETYQGEVSVNVPASSVHKAVRNILANEMNFSVEGVL